MKTRFQKSLFPALCALFSASVFAVPTWEMNPSGDDSYPQWSADPQNLLLGLTPSDSLFTSIGAEGSSNNPATLTDGILEQRPPLGNRLVFGNNGNYVEYTFEEPIQVAEFRLYTWWGNSDRNDISIESLQVKTLESPNNWVTLENSSVLWGHNRSSIRNLEGGSWIGRRASFKDDDVGYLALNVTHFRMTLGNQDNGYGGYIEMELIPPTRNPIFAPFSVPNTWSTLSASSKMLFVGVEATSCDVYFAIGQNPQALPPATRVASEVAANTPFSFEFTGLSQNTTYYYSLFATNNLGVGSSFNNGSFTTLFDADYGRKSDDGTVTHSANFVNHAFTKAGVYEFTPTEDVLVDILAVGGGGAGGWTIGGGGGGGQVVQQKNVMLKAGVTYAITVGAGGICPDRNNQWISGDNGGNSSVGDMVIAYGGGGGGNWNNGQGLNGGNGGGGSNRGAGGVPVDFKLGFAGGAADGDAPGGGGGAGGAGERGVHGGSAGAGGDGVALDFTGEVVTYGAGGGGGGGNNSVYGGAGGLGGGGAGGGRDSGTPGAPGTGIGAGGGGGSYSPATIGGNGHDGAVIIRYFNAYTHRNDVEPSVELVNVVEHAPLELSYRINQLGANAEEGTVSIAYGRTGSALSSTNELSSGVGPGFYDVTLDTLQPGWVYDARLIVVNDQGVTAASDLFTFRAPAAGVLLDQFNLDVTHLRTITVSSALVALGAGPNVVTLFVDGVPLRSEMLEDVGEFSLIWDGTQDQVGPTGETIPAAVFGETYTLGLVCTNTYNGLTWRHALEDTSFVCSDATGYVWTGNGEDNNWTNPDNWSGAPANGDGFGYPIVGSWANFPGNLDCEVNINSNVVTRGLTFNGRNANDYAKTHFTADEGCTLTLDPADARLGNPSINWNWYVDVTMDGATIINHGSGWYGIQDNLRFSLINGAHYTDQRLWFLKSNNHFLIASGSLFENNEGLCIEGNNTSFTLDDATLKLTGGFYPASNTTGDQVIFRGTHPKLLIGQELCVRNGGQPGHLVFEIPEGGYDSAPIEMLDGSRYILGQDRDDSLIFHIAENSPAAFAAAGTKTVTRLVSWPNGFKTEVIDLTSGMRPDPVTDFFSYGSDAYGNAFYIDATVYANDGTPTTPGSPVILDFGVTDLARYGATFSARLCSGADSATWSASWTVNGTPGGTVSGAIADSEVVEIPMENLPGGATVAVTLTLQNNLGNTASSGPLSFTLQPDQEATIGTLLGSGIKRKSLGTYTVYTFSDTQHDSTVEITRGGFAELLVVGGGGGGGAYIGGGGGGGGFVYRKEVYIPEGTYTVTVGAGGRGAINRYEPGSNGTDSSFGELLVAAGGGGGGSWEVRPGLAGGSGGGAAHNHRILSGGIVGQGFSGGSAHGVIAGGGGGAGAPGQTALEYYNNGNSSTFAASGGDGLPCAISGETVYYAGGGGSGAGDNGWEEQPYRSAALYGGPGGLGGGGKGGDRNASVPASDGMDGLGGGGGGAGGLNYEPAGGAGGDGVVILRVYTSTLDDPNPVVIFTGISDIESTSASFEWSLLRLGAGATACDVTLEYGTSPDALTQHLELATNLTAPTEGSTPMEALSSGTHYYGRIVAAANQSPDPASYATPVFSFETPRELDDMPPPSAIGLWQVKYTNNGINWDSDPMDTPVGSGEFDRHREFGAVMAYTNGSIPGTANPSLVNSWANNTTFAYVGYIFLQGGVTYSFQSRIDDTARIVIDNTPALEAATYTNPAIGSYTPAATGWYPIDIRVGDFSGGSGAISGDQSLNYHTGDGIWKKFVDPGDGSFLRTTSEEKIETLSIQKNGNTLRATLGYSESLAGATLTLCYGDTYEADDITSWDTTILGTLSASDIIRVEEFPLPEGTRFIRFLASQNGGFYWTQTTAIESLPEASLDTPVVALLGYESNTFYEADLSVALGSAGTGLTACDITVAYGPAIGSYYYTNTWNNVSLGSHTLTLGGLLPSHTYYAVLWAKNSLGVESPISQAFTVTTSELNEIPTPTDPGISLPGLWQGWKLGTDHNLYKTFDVLSQGQELHRELGAYMAYLTHTTPGGHAATMDGTFWRTTWQLNSAIGYTGYIWLEANTLYVFATHIDDATYLAIDGGIVLDVLSGAGTFNQATWASNYTGWHKFDLRMGDYGGNAGAAGTFAGVRFTTNPALIAAAAQGEPSPDGWTNLIDPGDGSLLRTGPFLRDFQLADFAIADGVFSASFTFDEGTECRLRVCYGNTYGGNHPSEWEHDALYSTPVFTETESLSWANLFSDAGTSVKYVRPYLSASDGSFMQWGPTLVLPDPSAPAFDGEIALNPQAGDAIEVSGRLAATGPETTAAVTIEVATSDDFSDSVLWPIGSFSAGTSFTATLTTNNLASAATIRPGADYFVRGIVTASNGLFDQTAALHITMPAGSELAYGTSADVDFWTLTFRGELETYGAGDGTTITLLTGPSADELAPTGEPLVVTAPGPFSFSVTYPAFNTPVYYAFVSENACSTLSWTSQSGISSATPVDQATYYWKADVAEGDWEDPDNWESSRLDPRLTFPHEANASASFERRGALPTTAYLHGDYAINRLKFNTEGQTLTLIGTGAETSGLTVNGLDVANYTTHEVRALRFQHNNTYNYPHGGVINILDGTEYTITGELYQFNDQVMSIAGRSTLYVGSNYRSRATDSRLVIDDSDVRIGQAFLPGDNSPAVSNVIEFVGSRPRLILGGDSTANNDGGATSTPILRFYLPEGGYEEPPIQRAAPWSSFLGGNWRGTPLRFEIAAESPAYKSGKATHQKLVDWRNNGGDDGRGINLDNNGARLDYANQPRESLTKFHFTYGANDSLTGSGSMATGFWVDVQGDGATILLFR